MGRIHGPAYRCQFISCCIVILYDDLLDKLPNKYQCLFPHLLAIALFNIFLCLCLRFHKEERPLFPEKRLLSQYPGRYLKVSSRLKEPIVVGASPKFAF